MDNAQLTTDDRHPRITIAHHGSGELKTYEYNMGLVSKNPVLWVCDEVLVKPAQLQRLARIVKFFMYQVSLFYFSESE